MTAYDFPTAKVASDAGIDLLLVGDSLGMVLQGQKNTLKTTLAEMIYHTRAVRNGTQHCLVIATLPFGSYNGLDEAVRNATRLMKEGGADGVHLEGTRQSGVLIRAMVSAGIPVMGHIGITKQKIVQSGMFKLPGRDADSAQELINDAVEMANSGVFALVLECLPVRLGEIISRSLDVPTISIGSGIYCDGQALVTQDMLGLFKGVSPRFLKVYADISQAIVTALTDFRQEVESGAYPSMEHSYTIEEAELRKLVTRLNS